jgi:hypothetical protein
MERETRLDIVGHDSVFGNETDSQGGQQPQKQRFREFG